MRRYCFCERSHCELLEERIVPFPVNEHVRVLSVDAHQDRILCLGPLKLVEQVRDAPTCIQQAGATDDQLRTREAYKAHAYIAKLHVD